MLSSPKLKIGGSRITKLGEGEYRLVTTRVTPSERQKIKDIVSREADRYSNMEDFLEDAVYKFLMARPYTKTYTFKFPCTSVQKIRGTDVIRRTGWRQLNVFLSDSLHQAMSSDLAALKKINPNMSVAAFLYTAIRWAMEKYEAKASHS